MEITEKDKIFWFNKLITALKELENSGKKEFKVEDLIKTMMKCNDRETKKLTMLLFTVQYYEEIYSKKF